MRTLDQIYWDTLCTNECGCKSLDEALRKHPRLAELRDGPSLCRGTGCSCRNIDDVLQNHPNPKGKL